MASAASLFLGLDVGTQGTKALLVDAAARRVVARAAAAYGLLSDLPPGSAEQHPDTWIAAVEATARQVLDGVAPERVAGIGVSGQQHGCVVLDADGEVVRPAKLWCDTSTAAEAEELSQQLGRPVPCGYTASKVLWLRRHEPANWARVHAVLLPHDYVNFRLTGSRSMECGDASGTGWFDACTRTFDAAAMRAVDAELAAKLPPLLPAGGLCGGLSADGARLLGLRQGTPVAAGGGDNMMAAIGAGATRPGVVVMSLGTSGTVFTRSEQPVLDRRGWIAPFCSSDGAWLPLLCVMNLTGVVEEVAAAFGGDHAALTAAARRVPFGSEGLLWLPFLQGERVPDLPAATGTLLGMRPGLLRAGHLYRAALEGTALNLAFGCARLRELGIAVDVVRVCGGASSNALWRQSLADLIGARVTPLLETESAALGAALQAIWSVRRQRGEDVGMDAVAAPFVQLAGESAEPDPACAPTAQLLRRRYAEALRLLHDVHG